MQVERSATSRGQRVSLGSRALAALAVVCITLPTAMSASAATLERIRDTGRIKLGYLADAPPFSHRGEAGDPEGYGIALCQQVAEQVKTQLALSGMTVEWVPVTADSRLREVQQGGIDLLCAPTIVTLARRQEVAFSIPIFAAGNRAVVRADAPAALREALAESPSTRPVWRGSPAAKVLEGTTFAVVSGTTSEKWLAGRREAFQIDAKIEPVADYRTALQALRDRKVDVLIGESSLILGAMDSSAQQDLVILDRLLTREPVALALARNDDDFRLVVDSALSNLYASEGFPELYKKWYGGFDENTRSFFLWNTLAP